MSTDLTFITNEQDKNLLERFEVLIKDTRFFDVLVGYFYTSGFHALYKSLETTEKIRILIGINTNRQIYDLIQDSKQGDLLLSHSEIKEQYSEAVSKEMESSEDNHQVEEGVQKFREWLLSGKMEIKAYPSENIHAKLYIMTFAEGDRDAGRIITGSSNFTQAGLIDNMEFNVELKTRADYDFALAKFNELWKNGVDVKEKYIQTIEEKTWLNSNITPYELYLKFLYEYFKEKINEDLDTIYKDNKYLPEGFIDLEYQDEAVKDALAKLGDYGGVFLADVVGLGKTYISALLAQQLEGHTLVLCPPVLAEYWHDTFRDFGIRAFDVESVGKLDKIIEKDPKKYRNVFIDEAHRFRNETNQTYSKLKQICWGKRVILVSATPLNNTLLDILSQVKLFQKGRNSTIPNVRNLDKFFVTLYKKQRKVSRSNIKEYLRIIKENSQIARDSVLKYLMVRRTRTEVLKYFKKDLDQRGLKFPSVSEPNKIYYEFDKELEKVFNSTIQLLMQFKYSRYMPLVYLKPITAELKQEIIGQRNLGRFMKILLVKRLESSFHAFKMTVNRFITSYERFIEMHKKGTIYISKKYNEKIYEALDNDDEEALLQLVEDEKVYKFKSNDFKKDFIEELEKDLAALKEIKKLWGKIDYDPKLQKFKDILKKDGDLKGNKLIVFTESRETAEYLEKNLKPTYKDEVMSYSSQSSAVIRDQIIANYDPNYRNQKDDIRILITTDILAEGVNMHRSNVVINYDIPWNPTKVLQRVGRINRIGTKHDKVHVYNFFPTIQANNEILLAEAAIAKLQAFHHTLGEDAQYLTEGEEISSHELFRKLNSRKIYENGEEGEEDSELKYLVEIRDIRDNNPQLYTKIKHLPKKSRSARQYPKFSNTVITFFKKGKLRKFYSADNVEAKELDFFNAAQILKCTPEDKRETISSEFYNYLAKNKEAFKLATTEEVREFKQTGGKSNETKILQTIKAIKKATGLTDEDEAYLSLVECTIKDGTLPKNIMKSIIIGIKKETNPIKILYKIKQGIPISFFSETVSDNPYLGSSLREVILSEYLLNKDK